jgi:hypothetical protein
MEQIYSTSNFALNDFVFATDLFKEVKEFMVANNRRTRQR